MTNIGSKVLLTLRIDNGDLVEVYLTKVYGRVVYDKDIVEIVGQKYNLIYGGWGKFNPMLAMEEC